MAVTWMLLLNMLFDLWSKNLNWSAAHILKLPLTAEVPGPVFDQLIDAWKVPATNNVQKQVITMPLANSKKVLLSQHLIPEVEHHLSVLVRQKITDVVTIPSKYHTKLVAHIITRLMSGKRNILDSFEMYSTKVALPHAKQLGKAIQAIEANIFCGVKIDATLNMHLGKGKFVCWCLDEYISQIKSHM